uniref:DNA helicase B winged helix domain-containing protein n=1 Tax=Oncorhynchus tshawytscha TaxID=74940 RepID=A0AAZ3SIM6_ONCTS
MSQLWCPVGDRILVGYILPEKKVKNSENDDSDWEDDDEEEEEEAQPEFLDMKEMDSVSSGGHVFNSSVPGRNEVDFLDSVSGKRCRVLGRFSLKDPWWEATCTARAARGKLVLRGYPAYRLRSDLQGGSDLQGDPDHSVLSLFLTACGVDAQFVVPFFAWLPMGRKLEFANLQEVLAEFEEGEQHRALAQQIKLMSSVCLSVAGMRVTAASLYPHVMRYLPTLLPGRFTELLSRGKKSPKHPAAQGATQIEEEEEEEDLSLLAKIEEMIKTDVWKLGFNYVMYKELKVVHCEAQLRSFHECKLFQEIPLKQRNALRVYDSLKNHCYRTGSTYTELPTLCDEVWDAVHFLKELGVVVQDRQKVALQNLHSYETGIAECLRCLVQEEPWVIPLDVIEVLTASALQRLRKKGGDGGSRDYQGEVDSDAERKADELNERCDMDGSAAETDRTSTAVRTVNLGPDQGPPPVDLGPDQGPPPVDLDPDQVRAAKMICFNPVTVISGKGGCGKTTVVSLVFKAALQQSPEKEVRKACWDFENDSLGSELEGEVKDEKKSSSWVLQGEDEVLLTAPTGRAASLLTKRTCFKAYTLHQVVWSFMQAKKDPSGAPEEWKFACVRVLVVDEGSLVCVQLLHSVLTMLTKHAQLRKFVILGTFVFNCPSIQPGNTLYDLFHSLGRAHWAIEMRTNHRAESQLIVDNAGQIAEMGMNRSFRPLHYDAILDLNGSYTMPSEDKRFILILLPNTTEDSDYDLQVAIELLLKAAPGLKNDATSQFIAFRRMECALINELCCKHYCDHRTKNNKNRLDFQPRDKVCCTKNGYVTDRNKERLRGNGATQRDGSGDKMKSKEKNKERLCNGEIFFIKHVRNERTNSYMCFRYLTLDDGDGRMLCVSFRELQRECKLQHAWARTIHTFQGSETETIVYVLGNGSVQTWKHVYTAVTRGQKRVYVIAKQEGMASAIKRRIIPRNTRLGTLVKELLVQPGAEGQDQPDQNQPQPAVPLHVNCADASDTSLMDDITFSQAYTWSPMNSSSEDPSQEQPGSCEEEEEEGIKMEASSSAVEDGHMGKGSYLAARSGVERTPSKRTLGPDSEKQNVTPHKQIKVREGGRGVSCFVVEAVHFLT